MKKTNLLLLFVFTATSVLAQNAEEAAAEFLRRDEKLYVVVSILVTIFAALIFFLISQEKRISRLEKQLKDKTHE
jgi:uncharacterized membrane protein